MEIHTGLIKAVTSNRVEIVDLFLTAKVDIHVKNNVSVCVMSQQSLHPINLFESFLNSRLFPKFYFSVSMIKFVVCCSAWRDGVVVWLQCKEILTWFNCYSKIGANNNDKEMAT